MMASPLATVQCMPDCLRRRPMTDSQPASTTPEPVNQPQRPLKHFHKLQMGCSALLRRSLVRAHRVVADSRDHLLTSAHTASAASSAAVCPGGLCEQPAQVRHGQRVFGIGTVLSYCLSCRYVSGCASDVMRAGTGLAGSLGVIISGDTDATGRSGVMLRAARGEVPGRGEAAAAGGLDAVVPGDAEPVAGAAAGVELGRLRSSSR
jgi:hypothetical protein